MWLNKSYVAWIKSMNDTSVSDDDSVCEVDNLKNKSETEKPFNDAPNDGKIERIAKALKQTYKFKSWFNLNPTISSKMLIQEGNSYLKRLILY
jgi:hypothetical protein